MEMRARSAAPLIDRCLRAASWPPLRALLHASPAPLAPKRARAEPSAAAPSGGGDAGDAAITSPEELSAALKRTLEHARRELAKLRGGSATPQMLDHITVEAYGERQPLSSLAQVQLRSPTLFVLSPFDAALSTAIATAVRDAGLNLNPLVEGLIIKVPVPKPSRETRDANIKLAGKVAEAAKATIRRQRQSALDGLKKLDGVSTDDVFRMTKELSTVATAATDDVTKLAERKRAEIDAA